MFIYDVTKTKQLFKNTPSISLKNTKKHKILSQQRQLISGD